MARSVTFGFLALVFALEGFAAKVVFDGECLPEVVALIKSAKQELVISIFDVNEPQIVDALMEAHFRGVKIRVIADRRQALSEHSRAADLFLVGIDVRLSSRGRLNHHKYAVADRAGSVNGSFNWTNGAARGNSEDLTVLEAGLLPSSEKTTIGDFRDRFEEQWLKNTELKSDIYFKRLFKEHGNDIWARWKPWVIKTLKWGAPTNATEDGRLYEAIELARHYITESPEVMDLVAEHAKAGGSAGVRSRLAAIGFLGDFKTQSPEHHELLLKAEHDSRDEVRVEAQFARVKIGGVLVGDERYEGVAGGVRGLKIYCGSYFGRLLR